MYNLTYLKNNFYVTLIKEDIRDAKQVEKASDRVDVVIPTAIQTAVNTTVLDPRTDFEINAMGMFNVLEATRKTGA
ncbi:MAG: GDP-mannose 4,6-dehydratase [Candidatus Methanoperedens sp.]|nr:GDP-mannose 4,6-dehydratase [Candidatus Methanoperedens sp.]